MRAPLYLALAAAGCATMGTVEKDVAGVLIPPSQENQLGAQFKTELETKNHVVYYNDPTVVSYVRGVADRVITYGKRERPDVNWTVNVIDDPKTVNAFATPGGYLYVYSGLLLSADNEAELAGVMAHETGHVVARHSARQMVDAYGLEAITNLALGKNPGLLGSLAANVGQKGFMLANSRQDETEADEYGARYSSAAGYNPHGLVTFFGKLRAMEGNSPRFLAILSDHPATPDRIDHVNAFIAKNNLGGAQTNEAQFQSIKRMVAQHQPAPRPAGAPSPSPQPQPQPSGGHHAGPPN